MATASSTTTTPPLKLKDYKALSFDIYATLIDWETGIHTALLPLLSRLPPSSPHNPTNESPAANKKFVLPLYHIHELAIQAASPTLEYPSVLAEVYRRLATVDLKVTFDEAEAVAFGASIGEWPAYPDTVEAMKTLGKYYKLIVLSNVDRSSFSRTNSGPLNGVNFNAIYTAQDIGSYKPDLQNFQYLVDHLDSEFGVKQEQILHVAQSLDFDHVPAKKFGLRPGVWISRAAGEGSTMGGSFEKLKSRGEIDVAAVFGTLGEFAEEVEKAFGGK